MSFLTRWFSRFRRPRTLDDFSYEDLPKILNIVERALIADIPPGVQKLGVSERCYCMLLVYFDSSFTEFTPIVWLMSEAARPALMEKHRTSIQEAQARIAKPKSPQDAELYRAVLDAALKHDTIGGHYPYSPAEVSPTYEYRPSGTALDNGCLVAYRLMLSTNKTGLPLPDESTMFKPFRDMMCRVARQLNALRWKDLLPTTDDFVVFAVDAIDNRSEEDFRASVPYELRKLLRSRKLIPQDWVGGQQPAR